MQKPFGSAAFNPFEFLTTPWGSLPMGSMMPGINSSGGIDLKEMDKRISELKAVEQWLSLNLNLLKTTIQGLEVQRGTLAAIQSFGEAMTKTADGSGANETTKNDWSSFLPPPPGGNEQATLWWDSIQKQFEQMMTAAQASAQSMTETKPVKKKAEKKTGDNDG